MSTVVAISHGALAEFVRGCAGVDVQDVCLSLPGIVCLFVRKA
jgi:hypothetical protein